MTNQNNYESQTNRNPSNATTYQDQMRKHRTAMLVTEVAEGEEGVRARPMAIVRIDADGTTYFLSPSDSGKVDELLESRTATITAQSSSAFASVRGIARVQNDPRLLDDLWSGGADLWFQGGKREAVAIAFKPVEAEFWTSDFAGIKLVLESARAAFKGEEVDPTKIGSHTHIDFRESSSGSASGNETLAINEEVSNARGRAVADA